MPEILRYAQDDSVVTSMALAESGEAPEVLRYAQDDSQYKTAVILSVAKDRWGE